MLTKYSNFYKNNVFRLSVEVFPPKTETGVNSLVEELEKIKKINPAYVSVTYGAMGSTRNLTGDLVVRIQSELQIPTAFHFTCVGLGKGAIKDYVNHLHDQNINLVVGLRGDKPSEDYQAPEDGFSYANELVSYLKTIHDFSIAVAGYPEKHIEAPSLEVDIDNLKRKVDAGADVIITQLFYNNNLFYDWLDKIRQKGIQIPVIPGIMPILSLKQISRITSLCGATLPKDLLKDLESHQEDAEATLKIGEDFAANQCLDLKANGLPGAHLYSLNKSRACLKISESL